MLDSGLVTAAPPPPELPRSLAGSPDRAGSLSPVVTAPQPPAGPAPADLVPPPRPGVRLLWYVGAMLLSVLLICTGLRLDRADLHAPFYYDLDALLILPLVKATLERGFGGHWRNEHLGAPGILELHDFPVIDHLHFLILWLLGKVTPDLIVLYNLYFLLTFPLTVLTAMLAFRHLGLTLPAAAVGGLLYAFLPFHYERWENHYFLAAYWMVPVSLLPAFAIGRGDFPFFVREPDGRYVARLRSWRVAGLVALLAAVASAGAYYAFFTCALTAFAGVYGVVAQRTWRAGAAAAGVCGLIVLFGLVNHLPTFVYQARHGPNRITDRYPEEADHYGLKIAHLVLPIEDHNLFLLRRVRMLYNSAMRPAETENRSATLGVPGTLGLALLVVVAVLPVGRGWPYGLLAGLVLFSLLLATIGGFGSVFNLLVTPQIRGYNRISVFVGFLCLFAVLWAIDRFLLTRTGRVPLKVVALPVVGLVGVLRAVRASSPRLDRWWSVLRQGTVPAGRFRYPVWAAALVGGFLDQTPYSWFRSGIIRTLDEAAQRFRADAAFFREIQNRMPPGAMIFNLPYAGFPETPEVYLLRPYENVRGYLHTDGLFWSYGAIKGREVDAWQREVSYSPPDELIRRVVVRGFDGLLIDRRGYPPTKEGNLGTAIAEAAHQMYARLAERPGIRLAEVSHEDGQQVFLDLRPLAELKRSRTPEAFEAEAAQEREYLAVLWFDGFFSPWAETPDYDKYRRGSPDGTVWFVNPSDRTRTFKVAMTFAVDQPGAFHFTLSGLADDAFVADKSAEVHWEKRLEIPPGRHGLRIRCRYPADFIPTDVRKTCYSVLGFWRGEVR